MVTGLLFSQLGYELGETATVIIRAPKIDFLTSKSKCQLIPLNGQSPHSASCIYWGEIWNSNWWIIDFNDIKEEGEWDIQVVDSDNIKLSAKQLRVKRNVLWDSTYEYAAVDMLERRKHFTDLGAGWQDAGTLWVESPAHSGSIICLADLSKHNNSRINNSFLKRIYEQITVGADYLVMTQQKAQENGHPKGAMCHDLLKQEKYVLSNDILKAVVALFKAAAVLPKRYTEKIESYKNAANTGFAYLLTHAKPNGDTGYNRKQRGLPSNTDIPKHEWLTRDLVFFCWAALESYKSGNIKHKARCIDYADQIIKRQITIENSEKGYYGHFREFDSLPHSENLWIHGVDGIFGADVGGVFPNYLIPFFEMIELWHDHEKVTLWRSSLQHYAEGFLIPTCSKNPFNLVPLGIFGDEGPIWFAGPFHGTNVTYGYTAAIAIKLSVLLNNPKLKIIATSNLQWIAGLNAGITKESLSASVVHSEDIDKNTAIPTSMICDIGNKHSGSWFKTRGVICNGFSTGSQFLMDTDPTKENDGPFAFTDEDWIPHSAAWITGLMALNDINNVEDV
ncbi:MAG: hypothetical protein V3V14_06440 [Saprospiraceae bacterium]